MDTIIINPRDKEERNFFLELARRLGVKAKTFEDLQDEQLLEAMEKNKNTPLTDKQNVLDTLQNNLNEDKPNYKQKTPAYR
ncbi:MAG: hypothetical protein K9G67_05955 [Bacteroidales bacterium]|nr:hypothetical protein [Bacteroidales bacterium]MCF8351055.1 hypothetical protein [Bacteroidales bacterium]MCF8375879.1 hypothetical protein [Bacteroidales bacterium]